MSACEYIKYVGVVGDTDNEESRRPALSEETERERASAPHQTAKTIRGIAQSFLPR